MESLDHTLRRFTRQAAIAANACLTMSTRARSTTEVSGSAARQDNTGDDDSLASTESSETDEVECCICLENVCAENVATLNGCVHKFCLGCISQWSEGSNLCPLCRNRFTSIESVGGVLQQVPNRCPATGIRLTELFNLEVGGGDDGAEARIRARLQLHIDELLEESMRRINEIRNESMPRAEGRHLDLAASDETFDLTVLAQQVAEQQAMHQQRLAVLLDRTRMLQDEVSYELSRMLANLRT